MNSRIQRDLRLAVRSILASSLAAACCASAADTDDPIETVRVYATAVDEDPENISSAYSILGGRQLRERAQATLGDTLNGLPGVNADTFGGGSARPIIRGQTAPRVKVLSDSIAILDASDISPDHAVAVEPSLVDRIEVLRGPATLLYGSGAIGGVVNVLDRKVPTTVPDERITGSLALRGGTVADERAGAVGITARATDHLMLRIEGASRDAKNYEAPHYAEPRVDGTWAESASGSIGLSWVSDRGYLGLAYTYRDDDYGLPGHHHEYEGCHPHDNLLHCGDHEAEGEGHEYDEHEHGVAPGIALLSKTFELRGEWHGPFAGVERIRLRASQTDYRHDEMEEGIVATTFSNEGYEARLEVQHADVLGWRGVIGAQYANTEFSARGDEAFLPTVKSETVGAFAVEHFELSDAWHFEAGARQEWQRHVPVNDPRNRRVFSDSATSVSAAVIWEVVPDYSLTLSGARSERLPHAQELYARGVHLATSTYECGLIAHPLTCGGLENNAPLATETSNNVELRLSSDVGALNFSIGAYYNKVDDYIYARTLDRFEDFRLIKYTQRDAEFTGAEAEVGYRFSERLTATVFGDYVRARFDDDSYLPRIPASRLGTRLNATVRNIGGELEYYRVNRQSDIADYESSTPGYDMVNATVSYRTGGKAGLEMYLRGSNLLDESAWNHASFLAGVVPLPGRNVVAGVTLQF
ncbi:TonB-dependent receptor domain-containing protein [Povalibacter sp.]|uniref:TonB-dependent receptor domain-containing protein n=1 Tax=Povalibacter sp. TaxID=1962978 RepID=UPI002F3F33AF